MPRTPCRTFQKRMDLPRWIKRFTRAGLAGAYLRVVTPGTIGAGDAVRVEHRPGHGVTVADLLAGGSSAALALLEAHEAGVVTLGPKLQRVVRRRTLAAARRAPLRPRQALACRARHRPGDPAPPDGALPASVAPDSGRQTRAVRGLRPRPVLRRALRLLRLQHLHGAELGGGADLAAYADDGDRRARPRGAGARRRRAAGARRVFFGGGTPTLLPAGDLAAAARRRPATGSALPRTRR